MKPVISTRIYLKTKKLIEQNCEKRGILVADWFKIAIGEEIKRQEVVSHSESLEKGGIK